MRQLVALAKARAQSLRLNPPRSPLGGNDDNKRRGTMSNLGASCSSYQGQPHGPQSQGSSFMIAVIWASLASC